MVEAAGAVIPGGSAIEINIDYPTGARQTDIVRGIDQIRHAIISGKWPPA